MGGDVREKGHVISDNNTACSHVSEKVVVHVFRHTHVDLIRAVSTQFEGARSRYPGHPVHPPPSAQRLLNVAQVTHGRRAYRKLLVRALERLYQLGSGEDIELFAVLGEPGACEMEHGESALR